MQLTETQIIFNLFRTHIFSPMCRGQQKRDVLSRLNDDYR